MAAPTTRAAMFLTRTPGSFKIPDGLQPDMPPESARAVSTAATHPEVLWLWCSSKTCFDEVRGAPGEWRNDQPASDAHRSKTNCPPPVQLLLSAFTSLRRQ